MRDEPKGYDPSWGRRPYAPGEDTRAGAYGPDGARRSEGAHRSDGAHKSDGAHRSDGLYRPGRPVSARHWADSAGEPNEPRLLEKILRSGLVTILKKELYRFFTDRRAIITTVLLPGLMVYLVYAVMGEAMGSMFAVNEGYEPKIMVVNTPSSIEAAADAAGLSLIAVVPEDINTVKDSIVEKKFDLLVIFPEDFDECVEALLAAIAAGAEATEPSDIELYYNSTVTESVLAFGMFSELLVEYRNALFTPFVINPGTETGAVYDLATEHDVSGFMLSSILPMLIIVFLFSGCMSVAPESIAGEKERGTIATLLVTPLKRYELAIGKVLALSCIALLAAISSFIGIIASIPRLMAGLNAAEMANISIYGAGDYVLLFVIIFSTVLFFVGLLSFVSALSKTVKEASTLTMPVMIIVMLLAVGGSFTGVSESAWLYFVPSLNSTQCLAGILSFNVQPHFIAQTIVMNIVYTAVFVFVLTRMFNNEKIVFSR